jgi:hypothetical protein
MKVYYVDQILAVLIYIAAPNTVVGFWKNLVEDQNCQNNSINEMFAVFLQALALAAAANAAELAEMNWKLKSSDEELDLVNERFDEAQG